MDTAGDRLGRAALAVTVLLILMVGITAAIAARPRGEVEIPAEWRSQSDYTLIILGRTSCPACESSSAFHRELAAAAGARGIRLVAASTGSAEDPAAFAASIGMTADHAVRAVPAPKNLKTVPAILIMKRDGAILKKTVGSLSPVQQRDWIRLVSSLR
jgi:hypothetical protein